MNLNIRISGQHIEFEPNTYYASFSGELEAAASILWAMVSHLKDNSNNAREFSANVIRHCLCAIVEWMNAISYRSPELVRKCETFAPIDQIVFFFTHNINGTFNHLPILFSDGSSKSFISFAIASLFLCLSTPSCQISRIYAQRAFARIIHAVSVDNAPTSSSGRNRR